MCIAILLDALCFAQYLPQEESDEVTINVLYQLDVFASKIPLEGSFVVDGVGKFY